MGFFKDRRPGSSRRILELPVGDISPNPYQPRTDFSPAALSELADSIAVHGVLQPLTVRATPEGWQLVSGERRLRAAKLAGLAAVPCLTTQADDEDSAVLALVENLQRRDLDFLDEALALSQLTATCRMTQEEVARRLGKSQSAVANKLRLLRLCPDALTLLRSKGFSERHARSLLRLPTDELQLQAAQVIVARDLTVRATEQYIDSLLSPVPAPSSPKLILKDVRIFLNTITKNLKLVQSAGIPAQCDREEDDQEIRLTITLPKAM